MLRSAMYTRDIVWLSPWDRLFMMTSPAWALSVRKVTVALKDSSPYIVPIQAMAVTPSSGIPVTMPSALTVASNQVTVSPSIVELPLLMSLAAYCDAVVSRAASSVV